MKLAKQWPELLVKRPTSSFVLFVSKQSLYDEFTIKDRFLYADTECNVWKLILFTIIFQKSFSNKTIVAMNLHQTLEIEVHKSVLSVRVSCSRISYEPTMYIHIIFILFKSHIFLFSGKVPFSTLPTKLKCLDLIDKFLIRKDYPATTFLFSIILVSQETSSWSYTIDTVYPAQCKPDTVNWLQMNFDLMPDRCLM